MVGEVVGEVEGAGAVGAEDEAAVFVVVEGVGGCGLRGCGRRLNWRGAMRMRMTGLLC